MASFLACLMRILDRRGACPANPYAGGPAEPKASTWRRRPARSRDGRSMALGNSLRTGFCKGAIYLRDRVTRRRRIDRPAAARHEPGHHQSLRVRQAATLRVAFRPLPSWRCTRPRVLTFGVPTWTIYAVVNAREWRFLTPRVDGIRCPEAWPAAESAPRTEPARHVYHIACNSTGGGAPANRGKRA